ncbi:type II secretion system F family protein [Nocardioides bizhenqiangii]|uniref:Type II secretion system F family protein n=1 Tax=Nocardioides bizhenqiangii TaxID=3095076 RepID=A0ABZ0ZMS6_9ACTN|nr:type II secretion system F family protein [Nocardioides sp. HM61]WQQ25066.1 type II secretion system F family protein [Nocardioides sp. HM61]
MRRYLLAVLAALAAIVVVVLAPSTAWGADDEPSIAHVETTDDGLRVLVSVPPDADVDLGGVTGTLDGDKLSTTATSTGTDATVQRTTVLAMDTSDSMARNGRFEAAKDAALTFLESVPADVEVGIVTFDGEVSTALEPTTDRAAAETVVAGLELSKGTLLYDGILAAVDLAGESGQRSVLVLSDGADTGKVTSISDVTSSIEATATLVDVVSLDQENNPRASAALSDLAASGQGEVIESTGDALADAFAAEAEGLAAQILVTAPLPTGFDAEEATVTITLPTASGELVASAFAKIQDAPDGATDQSTEPINPDDGLRLPEWALYVGILVFGIGLVTAAVLLVPGKKQPMTIAERVAAHTGGSADAMGDDKSGSEPMLDQAKAAAAGVLDRNKGLEDKLAMRLAAAGSAYKPSEWLLLHVGVVVGSGIFGFLLGGGNIVVGILFLIVGFFLPRVYLSFLASRRRKAFNSALPDTLQLLSGSLSAGLSLAQSVDTITREGQEPIASEFKRVLVENRIGVSIEDAFEGVAQRFNSKDFAWVVMAIRIQREVGGNLAELLTTVAATMREREYLRRQVNALAAEGKLSALILSIMPPAVFVFVLITNGEYVEPLFTEAIGIAILTGAGLWLGVGVFWMSRMVKVEV